MSYEFSLPVIPSFKRELVQIVVNENKNNPSIIADIFKKSLAWQIEDQFWLRKVADQYRKPDIQVLEQGNQRIDLIGSMPPELVLSVFRFMHRPSMNLSAVSTYWRSCLDQVYWTNECKNWCIPVEDNQSALKCYKKAFMQGKALVAKPFNFPYDPEASAIITTAFNTEKIAVLYECDKTCWTVKIFNYQWEQRGSFKIEQSKGGIDFRIWDKTVSLFGDSILDSYSIEFGTKKARIVGVDCYFRNCIYDENSQKIHSRPDPKLKEQSVGKDIGLQSSTCYTHEASWLGKDTEICFLSNHYLLKIDLSLSKLTFFERDTDKKIPLEIELPSDLAEYNVLKRQTFHRNLMANKYFITFVIKAGYSAQLYVINMSSLTYSKTEISLDDENDSVKIKHILPSGIIFETTNYDISDDLNKNIGYFYEFSKKNFKRIYTTNKSKKDLDYF